MFQDQSLESQKNAVPQPVFWAAHRQGNRLDCETGALMRASLAPLFEAAESWDGLRSMLRARALDFEFEKGRLVLVAQDSRAKVCSCRFLGFPMASLAARFGKLRVRSHEAVAGFGTLL